MSKIAIVALFLNLSFDGSSTCNRIVVGLAIIPLRLIMVIVAVGEG